MQTDANALSHGHATARLNLLRESSGAPLEPGVSVVIRNRNEAGHLSLVLRALSLQTLRCETILVDNESTDDSVALATAFGANVVRIGRESFTYGRALNLGLGLATSEVCVLLSAHSVPLGPSFLSECVRPFSDPAVAAVRCLLAGKRADHQRWVCPERITYPVSMETVVLKGPLASGCAIRRQVWCDIPFDDAAESAEDKLWALEVLKRGYAIYSPCGAAYSYIRGISFRERLARARLQSIPVLRATGVRTGFLRRTLAQGAVDVARVGYWSVRSITEEVVMGIWKCYLGLTAAVQARRRPRAGSVR